MSLPKDVVQQLKKLVQDNVNKYFGPVKPAEKTPDKVKFFAQKQLDFFINGIAKESPDLRKLWVKGHPYHVHLRMTSEANKFEIEITEDDGKF
ncbi:MAG TPA: hypothetical protein VIJ93_00770 [bacterium]